LAKMIEWMNWGDTNIMRETEGKCIAFLINGFGSMRSFARSPCSCAWNDWNFSMFTCETLHISCWRLHLGEGTKHCLLSLLSLLELWNLWILYALYASCVT
jgi:hypothetical protein